MFEEVEFPSDGATLRGRLYSHNKLLNPTVVMAHGTSATISMVADSYAEKIFAAGFDVLLYDNKNFGISGGEPRQQINPWIQARGYRDAVTYLRRRPDIGKIALWGDSYTAMIVLVAGALIQDIAAIVAQIPACGVQLPVVGPSNATLAEIQKILDSGDIEGGPEQTTGPMLVVSSDQINAPSLLAPIQAYRWFIEYGGRFGTKWENRASRVIPNTAVPFHAYLTAPYLDMPVQVMIGRDDEMIHCNRAVQQAVFDKIPNQKELYEIDGGHFGLLHQPGSLFDEAVAQQTGFLKRALS